MFMSHTPSEMEWSSLDKSDHSSRAWGVMVVNEIFAALVFLVLGLRMFTKIFMAGQLFVDDYLMTAAAILFTAFCALNMRAVHEGFGQHVWDLAGAGGTLHAASAAAAAAQRLNYAALIALGPAVVLAKLSVLAILLRVFPASMRALRGALRALAGAVTACCAGQALVVAFQCAPRLAASWAPLDAGACARAPPLQAVAAALGAVNVATDLAVCVVPIPYFARLNVSRQQRLCLCAVFGGGLIACGASFIRLLSLRGLHDNLDVTYVSVPYFNWSVVEVALIIITGSLPFMRPLLATVLPSFFKSHNFTSLFSSGKPAAGGCEFSPPPSYTSSCAPGDVTITKEFHLEETDGPPGGVDARLPGTPRVPFSPLGGFRSVVTCEKGRG